MVMRPIPSELFRGEMIWTVGSVLETSLRQISGQTITSEDEITVRIESHVMNDLFIIIIYHSDPLIIFHRI